MSSTDRESFTNLDVPEEITWEERFRDAVARGNELDIAHALRQAGTLHQHTVEVLAQLFEGGLDDVNGTDDLYPYRLLLVRKERGAPKDLELEWVRDRELVDWVSERLPKSKLRKTVILGAAIKFGLSRSRVYEIIREHGLLKRDKRIR